MDIVKYWIKYINYPLALLISGKLPRIVSYNNCISKQYRTFEENIMEQREKLYDIVMYAIQHVPYYQDFVSQRQLSLSKETIMEDIKQLPIITKEIVRKEGDRLYSAELLDYYIANFWWIDRRTSAVKAR